MNWLLEVVWLAASKHSNPTERHFLRTLHNCPWFSIWARTVLHTIGGGAITSIWVDHTPQCWYGGSPPSWTKPSCELADLLVVIWDSPALATGRALLVQGKVGKSPQRISLSNVSTKREIQLLGAAPQFLLSAQTSVRKGEYPNPFSKTYDCEFQLPPYVHGRRLEHCTFLQIRKPGAVRWKQGTWSWQSLWPPNQDLESYGNVLTSMVDNSAGSLGKPFVYGEINDDWNRLVTVLIQETLTAAKGTSGGYRQNSVSVTMEAEIDWAEGWSVSREMYFAPGVPEIAKLSEHEGPSGIPVLFIMPSNPERVNSYRTS